QGAARGGFRQAARCALLRVLRRGRAGLERNRSRPLHRGVGYQGRVPQIQVQRRGRGGACGSAARNRGQDRGNAARNRRAAHRPLADPAGAGGRGHQGKLRDRRGADRQARQPRPAGAARQGQGDGTALRRAHARGVRRFPVHVRGCDMTPFELVEPASLDEAIALLDAEDPTVRPIAGGTALMLKAGVFRPRRLVSLRKLAARYSRVAAGKDGALTIGAMTPLAVVERSPEVARAAPVITRTMRRLSNIRVRNVATVGGNLAHGDPHMDLPPVLIALRAEVAVVGAEGARTRERTIAVEDLFAGYFETVLAKNELIAELRIPAQSRSRAAYLKVTTGSAEDWPALGVAVALEAEGRAVKSARVVVSAATEKATRLEAAERSLAGATIADRTLARAGDAAADEAECISDVRGSAAYKRELTRVYVARAVRQALDGNGATY